MTSNYNECFYFDAEKDNASSMLKKCINGPGGEWAWPCSEKVEIDNALFGTVMERPSGDNSVKPLPHSNEPTKHGPSDHGSTYESMKNLLVMLKASLIWENITLDQVIVQMDINGVT